MARKHLATALLVSASLAFSGNFATAQPGKEKNAGRGNAGGNAAGAQQKGKGHKHAQKNGRNMLGAKLKQNGKHAIDKLANRDVVADVKDGKVANMTAGDLPVKRVRSKQKMAMIDNAIIPIAWPAPTTPLRLAQYGGYDTYYYGYCFDDGYDFVCYWYPAEDVYYTEYSWDDYDPYY